MEKFAFAHVVELRRVKSSTFSAKSKRHKTAVKQPAREAKDVAGNPVESKTKPFPIVGVGASAGGLEAFSQLLKHLPLDSGMGFVLVQHLDPAHDSALPQLLTRATSIPVSEATNNLRVERNHVYVIPPNTNLTIAQGVLKLQPRQSGRAPHHSVDLFFESLAHDQRECAVGVILSGTASDGTLGLEAIKAEGGITFAQDKSARHDSMPRNAIAAGCVDFVLSPENIAKELARIAKHPYVAGRPPGPFAAEEDRAFATGHEEDETPLPSGGRASPDTGARRARAEAKTRRGKPEEDGFKKILLLLRNHSGVDFSLYKSSTVQRRIDRRMVLNKLDGLSAYARFLGSQTKELEALYSDMLISVTTFFRNPGAFEVLKHKVFPRLVQQPPDQPLRIWVLGCSTGQEAYSIAISFVEFSEQAGHAHKLQLFGTDASETLLDKARAGLYAESLVHDLSPQRLRRFFVREDGGYRVAKFLREMVLFARQNVLSDPPFSRMDLISCRNLLIYIEPDAQRRVLPTLHYALKPQGFLFLGESESLGSSAELFETVDKKHRIFSKKPGLTAHLHFAPRYPGEKKEIPAPKPSGASAGFHAQGNVQREVDRIMLGRYAPPGVLVDAHLHVFQFRGDTSRWLKPPTGEASFNLLKMAREGLMLPLRAAINKARKDNKTVRRENLRVQQNGSTRRANFEVIPLRNLRERCFLILFEHAEESHRSKQRERREKQLPASSSLASVKSSPRRNAELERELFETRDYLQSIQEQYESANEELQASNEEVQSANEELQSINEELETSKEELESANEELSTVNDEMLSRNAELNRSNADLNNLHASVNVAILVVARDLAIRRFTPPAQKLFNLVATDVGRPLTNVRHNLDLADLDDLLKAVIATNSEREREVRDKGGRWFSLRARPYLTLDNKIDGAVLVLVDIDALKRSEQAVTAARDYAASIVETVREPLLVLDGELRVERANRSFYHTFRVAPAGTVGKSIFELGNRQWDIPRLRILLDEILSKHTTMENFEVEHDFEQLGRRSMLLNARRIEDPAGKPPRILLAIEDLTELKRHQKELQHARLAEAVLATARDPLMILNEDLSVQLANEAFYKVFKVSLAETEARSIFELGSRQWDLPRLRELLENVIPRRSFFDNFEVSRDFPKLGARTMLLNARTLAGDGDPQRILLGIQDITDLLHYQAELRRSEATLREAQALLADRARLLEDTVRERTVAPGCYTHLTVPT
jgi:two-component system CheB/CheR fusion protein